MPNTQSWVTQVIGALSLTAMAHAQVTVRASVGARAIQANGPCFFGSMSADGQLVCLASGAGDLIPGDSNGRWDVFVRDRAGGTTERVSIAWDGGQAAGDSDDGYMSGSGRFVAFRSFASNLVPNDTNAVEDVFLHDRRSRTTERVSISSAGAEGNNYSDGGRVTNNGRYIVFESAATNFGPPCPPSQVFVRDRLLGTTELVSVGTGGSLPDHQSWGGSISADGRYIAFVSDASSLVAGDTNGDSDVFVHDRQTGITDRVNVASDGSQANGTFGQDISAWISTNGCFVVFEQAASNLVSGDSNGSSDVFVRDLRLATTERVSVSSGGVQADAGNSWPWISEGGRFVVFGSGATNLVAGDTNGMWDIFVRDRRAGTTERVSVSSGGDQANGLPSGHVGGSDDGRCVCFDSAATDLVPGDTNGVEDVFVRDRLGAPHFISICSPGVGGVLVCPCANQPSGPGRGCENSAGTGGALLSAAGGTFLSSDSLVFTTSGQRPTALSIVMQGDSAAPGGIVYGQGVRCVSGHLLRLYTKAAALGSVIAPDFGAGDSPVSARSAAAGDVIQMGQTRWYLVYYRDPIVLGGCPPGSTFNATQTGQVTWSP
jgi:Tol biopolymer transport system component